MKSYGRLVPSDASNLLDGFITLRGNVKPKYIEYPSVETRQSKTRSLFPHKK